MAYSVFQPTDTCRWYSCANLALHRVTHAKCPDLPDTRSHELSLQNEEFTLVLVLHAVIELSPKAGRTTPPGS